MGDRSRLQGTLDFVKGTRLFIEQLQSGMTGTLFTEMGLDGEMALVYAVEGEKAVGMNASQTTESSDISHIPSTLRHPRALHFWSAVAFIGVTTGIGAALLTKLLELVQRIAWRDDSIGLLKAAQNVPLERHVLILLGAALVTG